jgi:hypothetical protein
MEHVTLMGETKRKTYTPYQTLLKEAYVHVLSPE